MCAYYKDNFSSKARFFFRSWVCRTLKLHLSMLILFYAYPGVWFYALLILCICAIKKMCICAIKKNEEKKPKKLLCHKKGYSTNIIKSFGQKRQLNWTLDSSNFFLTKYSMNIPPVKNGNKEAHRFIFWYLVPKLDQLLEKKRE